MRTKRSARVVVSILTGTLFVFALLMLASSSSPAHASQQRGGVVLSELVNAPAFQPAKATPPPSPGFARQTSLGFTSGDQWEPAIAADRFGHVYVLYPQYHGVPDCPLCFSPTMILQISSDRGATWASPALIYPAGASLGQWDAQIVVPGHGPISDKDGVRRLKHYFEFITAEARKRFDAGMSDDEAAKDIKHDFFRDWIDDERLILNVNGLYREFAGARTEPDLDDLRSRMLRWRRTRRDASHAVPTPHRHPH